MKMFRVGVFGDSAVGKTTLLAMFYDHFKSQYGGSYHLAVAGTRAIDMQKLVARTKKALKSSHKPPGTTTTSTTVFKLHVAEIADPILSLTWIDYPGGWWGPSELEASETQAKSKTFTRLTQSDIGVILLDGDRLRQHSDAYAREVLAQMAKNVEAVKKANVLDEQNSIVKYPNRWIVAATKSDLLDDSFSADDLEDMVWNQAEKELTQLLSVVGNSGEECVFMVLSSLHAAHSRVMQSGIDCLLPVMVLWELRATAVRKGLIQRLVGVVPPVARTLDKLFGNRVPGVSLLLQEPLKWVQALAERAGGSSTALKGVCSGMATTLTSPEAKRRCRGFGIGSRAPV